MRRAQRRISALLAEHLDHLRLAYEALTQHQQTSVMPESHARVTLEFLSLPYCELATAVRKNDRPRLVEP